MGLNTNFDIRQPPGIASADQYATFGWADPRLGNPATQTEDVFTTVAQFAALPTGASSTLKYLAAAFAGLAAAGVIILALVAVRRRPSATVAEATTASYHMALVIGPVEEMLPDATATATTGHAMQGEVMLRGKIMTLPGMSMGSGGGAMSPPVEDRHMEVHICSKNGKVVQDAQPQITVTDNSAGSTSQQVPVAVMEGAGQGTEDLHYGNNVVMAPGHDFT